LRAEKAALQHKIRQEGFELGICSTTKLADKDFHHCEQVSALSDSLDEDALNHLWTFLDRKHYPEQAQTHDSAFAHLLEADPTSRPIFARRWLEGVLSVWRTIEPQVEAENQISQTGRSRHPNGDRPV